jgi:hypothetical protein
MNQEVTSRKAVQQREKVAWTHEPLCTCTTPICSCNKMRYLPDTRTIDPLCVWGDEGPV